MGVDAVLYTYFVAAAGLECASSLSIRRRKLATRALIRCSPIDVGNSAGGTGLRPCESLQKKYTGTPRQYTAKKHQHTTAIARWSPS